MEESYIIADSGSHSARLDNDKHELVIEIRRSSLVVQRFRFNMKDELLPGKTVNLF